MSDNTKEIHIDETGFLTPGKAITISTMSLFIWILTGICYKAMTFVASCVNYQAVTFFASLLLSCICGFYLVKKILKNATFSTKFILGFANVLLLYTSANGIQTGYCFISKPASGELKECSLIPFLVARPWLPDKFTASEIESLEQENKNLREQISAIPDPSGYVRTIQDLTAKNQYLTQQLERAIIDDSLRCATLISQTSTSENADDKATIARLQNTVAQFTQLNNNLFTLQQLRQSACINKGEAAAFRMLNEMCGNDPNAASQFRNIIANLKPVVNTQ